MDSAVLAILYTLQSAFSAYNLYLISISIANLQKYEEISKKTAEYSNIAEHQLYKTRTTQASGTIAIALSFLSSVYLLSCSVLAELAEPRWRELGVMGVNVAALLGASKHVGNFWRRKAKVPLPGVGKYNDAISNTQEARLNMRYLAASWVVCVVLSLAL